MTTPETSSSSKIGAKEEDWELVSEAKSLTTVDEKPDSLSAKDAEDWFKTIPATPANTPEFTPQPPPYPAVGVRKPDIPGPVDGELEPIQEVAEEHILVDVEHPSKPSEEKTPDMPDDSVVKEKESTPTAEPLGVVASGVVRLVLYAALFYVLKKIVSQLWHKFRPPRSIPIPEKSE